MTWYLVSTAPQELSYWKKIIVVNPDDGSETESQVWTTEIVPANVVTNRIVYDGVSPFTPPANNILCESNNEYNPGDLYNK